MKTSFGRWIIYIVSLLMIGFAEQAKSQSTIQERPYWNGMRIISENGKHIDMTIEEYSIFVHFVWKITESYHPNRPVKRRFKFPYRTNITKTYSIVFSYKPVDSKSGYFKVGKSDKVYFITEELYGAMLKYAEMKMQE